MLPDVITFTSCISACQCLGSGYRFRVEGLPGLGYRVEGLGYRVEGLGYRVEGLGLRVEGLGLRV